MRRTQFCLWVLFGVGVVHLAVPPNAAWGEKFDAKAKLDPPAIGDDSSPGELLRHGLQMAAIGDNEQFRLLTKAALTKDPGFPEANWHAGRVRGYGDWLTVREAESFAANDRVLSQYRRMRSAVERNGDLELNLARWCAEQGQRDLARIHYARLLSATPDDPSLVMEAARRAGIGFVQGQLLTVEEVDTRISVAEQKQKALEQWRPRLEQWAQQFAGESESSSVPAQSQLDAVDDPSIVYAVESYLDDSRDAFVLHLLDKVAQFPDYDATQVILRFALLAPSESVRDRAESELKTRPLHDFVPTLLDGFSYPIQATFRITRDVLTGGIRYQHVYLQETAQGTRIVETDHRAVPRNTNNAVPFTGEDTSDPTGVLTLAQGAAIDSQARFLGWMIASQRQMDVMRSNQQTELANARIFALLESATEESLARQPGVWRDWWTNYNETNPLRPVSYQYLPTMDFYNTPSFGLAIPATSDSNNPPRFGGFRSRSSCFAPGTVVWTQTGKVAIERVQIGDRVLSQNPDSGELTYKVVVRTTVGAPTGRICRLTVADKPIDITTGHVVWVENLGWRMVKELDAQSFLHGIGQIMPVQKQELRDVIPLVHNLVVSDTHTFFVGDAGVLVHDVTPRRHTHAVVPGLQK